MKKIILTATAFAALIAAPARADDMMDNAVKLVAVAAFVKDFCPGMQPNMMMVMAALDGMGVNVKTIAANSGQMLKGQLYVNVLKRDTKVGCSTMWTMFGKDGTEVAGIIERN
jgi:hypothetical protein